MTIIFIDTETTGLPTSMAISPAKFNHWPRLVEIGWAITDSKGVILKDFNYIIRPEGYQILNSNIHGITTEKAYKEGVELKEALTFLRQDLMHADLCVAHNVIFDMNVLAAAEYRTFNFAIADKVPWFCTKEGTANILKIPRPPGHTYESEYKWPSLQELLFHLFFIHAEIKHRSLSDALQVKTCYFELLRRKQIEAGQTTHPPQAIII